MKNIFLFFLLTPLVFCGWPSASVKLVEDTGFTETNHLSIPHFTLKDHHITLPENARDKLTSFTETLAFIILNFYLIKIIAIQYDRYDSHIRFSLETLAKSMTALHRALVHPNILKRFLPRVEDQATNKTKILAKYRRDMIYPWASKFETIYMVKEAFDILKNSSGPIDSNIDFFLYLDSHKSDDTPIFIRTKGFRSNTIIEMRKNLFCYLRQVVYVIIFEMVRQQTGLSVSSIKELYSLCTVEGINYNLYQPERGNLEKTFYDLPFIRFRAKSLSPVFNNLK